MTMRVTPLQERSQARVERILDAAREHLSEVGFLRFSLDAVAQRAECSVPTIYRYFLNRADLLETVAPGRADAEAFLDAVLIIQESSMTHEEKWTAVSELL